jgi:DNA (cytosine-5)-methyltransferase 1
MHRLGHLDNEPTDMPSKSDTEETVKARRGRPAGSGKNPSSRGGTIGYKEALDLILTAESGNEDLTEHQKEELPAIVSHWLQSPEDQPILLDQSYGKTWMEMLRTHLFLKGNGPVHGLSKSVKSPKPITVDFSGIPFPPTEKPKFTFIDLFAGIGGFRLALQELGGKCVFSSEWDVHAKETYFANYGEVPFGDITKFTKSGSITSTVATALPSHTILCGGFPCQPFSQAGLKRGFDDARGTLFFDILKIARDLRPPVLFLENVKRLKSHDGGRTLEVICKSLREINYKVYAKVLKASDYDVPQNRERIFIVAFAEPIYFEFPKPILKTKKVGDILEKNPDPKYTLSDALWKGHQRRLREHREKGNGFGYSLFNHDSEYVNTISARYWKDGSEILIEQEGRNPRILTPRECVGVQGFPDGFLVHPSKRYAYQQFGNSVAKPVVRAVMSNILQYYKNPVKLSSSGDQFSPVII